MHMYKDRLGYIKVRRAPHTQYPVQEQGGGIPYTAHGAQITSPLIFVFMLIQVRIGLHRSVRKEVQLGQGQSTTQGIELEKKLKIKKGGYLFSKSTTRESSDRDSTIRVRVSLVKYKIREITILKVRTKHRVVTYIRWVALLSGDKKCIFIVKEIGNRMK